MCIFHLPIIGKHCRACVANLNLNLDLTLLIFLQLMGNKDRVAPESQYVIQDETAGVNFTTNLRVDF